MVAVCIGVRELSGRNRKLAFFLVSPLFIGFILLGLLKCKVVFCSLYWLARLQKKCKELGKKGTAAGSRSRYVVPVPVPHYLLS